MENNNKEDLKNVLVLTDYISTYCWLIPYEHTDSEAPTSNLAKFVASSQDMT